MAKGKVIRREQIINTVKDLFFISFSASSPSISLMFTFLPVDAGGVWGKKKQNITGRTVKSIVASLTGNNTTWGAEVVLSPELCDDLNITWQKIEDNLYSKLENRN